MTYQEEFSDSVVTLDAALGSEVLPVQQAASVVSYGIPAILPREERLTSLDALRGLDMLLIIGGGSILQELVTLLRAVPALHSIAGPMEFVSSQLEHKDWQGMSLEDFIFPLFIFMVGVSVVFSLSKALALHSRPRILGRIAVRTCVLYLLGLMLYHGFDQPIHAFHGMTKAEHAVRWLGVLQRIAICYGITAGLFCLFRPRVLVAVAIALLLGYWLLMSRVYVPGAGRGSYAEGRNLANYLDQRYLGGFKWDGDHDPEGLLSTMPAIASCLLGVFAGLLLRRGQLKPYATAAALVVGGAALAAGGYAWGFLPSAVQFPVIKKLWTSSFVLLAGGYGAMLLGLFYLVIDVWKLRGWAMPFAWVGTNAILLYVLASLGFIRRVAELLIGGGRHDWPIFGAAQGLITSIMALFLTFLVARFLYRRGVFIRA